MIFRNLLRIASYVAPVRKLTYIHTYYANIMLNAFKCPYYTEPNTHTNLGMSLLLIGADLGGSLGSLNLALGMILM